MVPLRLLFQRESSTRFERALRPVEIVPVSWFSVSLILVTLSPDTVIPCHCPSGFVVFQFVLVFQLSPPASS